SDAAPRWEHAERMLERFSQAASTGDMDGLLALLAEDIALWSDGGGKVAAALKPIHGADQVARFILGARRKFVPADQVVRRAEVNGQPGVVAYVGGKPRAAKVVDILGNRIQTRNNISDPAKSQALQEAGHHPQLP